MPEMPIRNVSAEANSREGNDLRRYGVPVVRFTLVLIGLAVLLPRASLAEETPSAQIPWQPWSNEVFARAEKEHRFVLLDLGAVWCHWCHVMEDITYRDPKVIALIRQRYIAVRVDQDARPDLSNRYEDYGWPATVVFNFDGSEIVKRQG